MLPVMTQIKGSLFEWAMCREECLPCFVSSTGKCKLLINCAFKNSQTLTVCLARAGRKAFSKLQGFEMDGWDSSEGRPLYLTLPRCERAGQVCAAVCAAVCVFAGGSSGFNVTFFAGDAALQNLLDPPCHVRHVLGDGLDPLHQTYRLNSDPQKKRGDAHTNNAEAHRIFLSHFSQ